MSKNKRKLSVFTIDNRASIATGYISGSEHEVDLFLKFLKDAMDKVDADPSSGSLTPEDKADFWAVREEGSDPFLVFGPGKKVHTIDDFLKRKRRA